MSKSVISTSRAASPGGAYSQAVVAHGFVFIAGQGPTAPDGTPIRGSFDEQARQTFENLAAVAEAAGASLADAVKVGVYLRDMANFPRMNELYRQWFNADLPARTTVQSDLPGFEIEVDAILALPSSSRVNRGGAPTA